MSELEHEGDGSCIDEDGAGASGDSIVQMREKLWIKLVQVRVELRIKLVYRRIELVQVKIKLVH